MIALTHLLFAEERSLELLSQGKETEALASFIAVAKRYPETRLAAQLASIVAVSNGFATQKSIVSFIKGTINAVGNPWRGRYTSRSGLV